MAQSSRGLFLAGAELCEDPLLGGGAGCFFNATGYEPLPVESIGWHGIEDRVLL